MEAQSLSTCSQCGKKFQRKAHLLRHQQQHSGDRPYSCQFCNKTFKRSDVLRDHFSRCDRRGNSAIPNSLERGRKRHACDECSRLKVKCDNNVPCRKCLEFNRTCVKTRPGGAPSPEQASTPSVSTPDTPSDRNSIGFLLNCPGETDFMREFPKSTALSPIHNSAEVAGLAASGDVYNAVGGDISASTLANRPYGYTAPENNLDVFLGNLAFQTTFERQTNQWGAHGEDVSPWLRPNMQFWDRGALEQRAFDIREKLKYTAATQHAQHLPSAELLEAIELISANKIVECIGLYFKHWHQHAPMVHEATFNPCTAALPIVLALMGLGGMYSKEHEDVTKLKYLLDTIETFIFSIPGLNVEYDAPGRVYIRHGPEASEEWQQYQLEELQGAYLFIVLQYWTGNDIARTRVRQQRFARIIAIFHHLELQTVQHLEDFVIKDQASFRSWVRKESCIRTAGITTMLDNTFGIFNNVPPRLQWAELDLTFPSSDVYFKLANYDEMRAQNLYPQPKMKIKDAFMALLVPSQTADDDLKSLRAAHLTALDMQMLILFLYTHVWQSTFNCPVFSLADVAITSITTPFKRAMSNWKLTWDHIRSASVESEWNKLGFQRTAETYYDAVSAIIKVFEKMEGRFPPIPSDCDKGTHLKRLLSF